MIYLIFTNLRYRVLSLKTSVSFDGIDLNKTLPLIKTIIEPVRFDYQFLCWKKIQ